MSANSYEAEKSVENEKKGTPGGHQAEVSPFPITPKEPRKAVRAAKSAVDYWKDKVRSRVLKDGSITPELYVRLKRGGRDAWFSLATANRGEAARKARDLWVQVEAKGLAEVQAALRFDPRPERSATVGELLAVAKEKAGVRPRTFHQYETSLRQLVAGVLGMEPTPAIYAAGSEASKAWRAKVEGARLDILSADRIAAWRKAYVETTTDANTRETRGHTADAVIRNARPFFTAKRVKAYGTALRLPEPLPFDGITAGSSTRRFNNKTDPRKLYAAGMKELADDTLTAFLLCLTGGLRRGEADMLPWAHVDTKAGTLRIDTTRWFQPKTDESKRTTPISADVVAHLRELRKRNRGAEFVLSGMPPERPRPPNQPRCACWKALRAWLRVKGFETQNPVHELRKLSGSFVYQAAGIEAARQHLGHRNISTTAASYVTGSAAVVDLSGKKGGRHA